EDAKESGGGGGSGGGKTSMLPGDVGEVVASAHGSHSESTSPPPPPPRPFRCAVARGGDCEGRWAHRRRRRRSLHRPGPCARALLIVRPPSPANRSLADSSSSPSSPSSLPVCDPS